MLVNAIWARLDDLNIKPVTRNMSAAQMDMR